MTAGDIVGFVIVAAIGLGLGWKALRAGQSLVRYATATGPDSAVDGGTVAFEGVVEPSTEPVEGLVSGEPCVGYLAVLEQQYRSRILLRWHGDYVTGTLPTFGVRTPDDTTVEVDLTALVPADGPSATLTGLAPPGGFGSPIQLPARVTTNRVAPGDELAERYRPFERVRNEAYPVRVSEYRLDAGDSVFVAGTRSVTAETSTVQGDDLLVLAPDARTARRTLATEAVAWCVASAIFLLPAALWLYTGIAT